MSVTRPYPQNVL